MIYSNERALPRTFAEFFAGIGLIRIGLEEAGWKIKFANDIDLVKEKIYQGHFQDLDEPFVLGDIHDLSVADIPSVCLATASFPCTDLSLAGRREGLSGRQSSAFWGFIKLMKDLNERRPPVVLLENVEGFLTSNKGKDFKEALMALNELGYLVDAFIINASHFVPQSRVRLFVVAYQNFTSHISVKEQLSFYQSELRPKKLVDFIFNHPEIKWGIRELPSLPRRTLCLADVIDTTLENSSDWWSEERVAYLLNQTSPRHLLIVKELQNRQHYSYLTAFRRMRKERSMAEIRSDGIAGCLRTPKGGSARQILLCVGFGEVKIRFLSPRECAKLMGADDYKITKNVNEALFGFGDAVCVPVVKWIAEHYLNPLLSTLYKNKKLQNGLAAAVYGI